MSVAVYIEDGSDLYEVHYGTPAWHASLEWARFHGLDPNQIPEASTVVRDAAGRRLIYDTFVKDGPGLHDILIRDGEAVTERRVEQGEAPPLPLPAEITG